MKLTACSIGYRATDLVTLALLLGIAASVLVFYDQMPAMMQIHYTPPGGVYYGIERVPKQIGLLILPLISTMIFAIGQVIARCTARIEEFEAGRRYAGLAVVVVLAVLACGQALLILLNLG
jgi:uncharacterized membrane protein